MYLFNAIVNEHSSLLKIHQSNEDDDDDVNKITNSTKEKISIQKNRKYTMNKELQRVEHQKR